MSVVRVELMILPYILSSSLSESCRCLCLVRAKLASDRSYLCSGIPRSLGRNLIPRYCFCTGFIHQIVMKAFRGSSLLFSALLLFFHSFPGYSASERVFCDCDCVRSGSINVHVRLSARFRFALSCTLPVQPFRGMHRRCVWHGMGRSRTLHQPFEQRHAPYIVRGLFPRRQFRLCDGDRSLGGLPSVAG